MSIVVTRVQSTAKLDPPVKALGFRPWVPSEGHEPDAGRTRRATACRSPTSTSRSSTDAGATKRDLVDYLDGVRDRILPALEDRPLSVIRVHRGQEAFMQKNVPKYTPDWVRTVTSGRRPPSATCPTRLQRPPHAAVVRQPAGDRVPPRPRPGRRSRPHDAPGARPRPARGRLVRRGGAGGPARAPGARRPRAGGRGEDERRQGPPRVRADRRSRPSMEDAAAATRAIAGRAAALDPERRHDRVREGRARRPGLRRLHARRRRRP